MGGSFDYWRDRLTPYLIEEVKRAGGTLLFLASDEMRGLFHWAEVERAVRVITPTFLVRQPTGRLKQIVVYTKMARGAMAGEVIRQRSRMRKPCVCSLPRLRLRSRGVD